MDYYSASVIGFMSKSQGQEDDMDLVSGISVLFKTQKID
jgi:hypothetical protein